MAKTPEGKVKEKVDEILENVYAYIITPTTGGFGKSGHADRIACIPNAAGHVGSFVGIEVKAGKKKPTALQSRRLQEILKAGGFAAVVNETNIDEFAQWVDDIYYGVPGTIECLLPKGVTLQTDTKVGL